MFFNMKSAHECLKRKIVIINSVVNKIKANVRVFLLVQLSWHIINLLRPLGHVNVRPGTIKRSVDAQRSPQMCFHPIKLHDSLTSLLVKCNVINSMII